MMSLFIKPYVREALKRVMRVFVRAIGKERFVLMAYTAKNPNLSHFLHSLSPLLERIYHEALKEIAGLRLDFLSIDEVAEALVEGLREEGVQVDFMVESFIRGLVSSLYRDLHEVRSACQGGGEG